MQIAKVISFFLLYIITRRLSELRRLFFEAIGVNIQKNLVFTVVVMLRLLEPLWLLVDR